MRALGGLSSQWLATGCLGADSQLPREGALALWREIRGLEKGGQKQEGRREQEEPKAVLSRRGNACLPSHPRCTSPPLPTQTLAPQPALLEAEDAHFGEDIHQVAIAKPAVLAGAAPPPAGRGPVPVLLPRLPLLTDQAAGDGRGHGGPGNGSRGGRDRGKGS